MPYRKGDRFKVIGQIGDTYVTESEQPDGSVVRSRCALTKDMEGKPIPAEAELMTVKHLQANEYEVQTSTHTGPPRVSNQPYRDGWTSIFGAERTREFN